MLVIHLLRYIKYYLLSLPKCIKDTMVHRPVDTLQQHAILTNRAASSVLHNMSVMDTNIKYVNIFGD